MKALSELIEDRAKGLDVQIVKAKQLKPEQKKWLEVEKELENLPNDYISLLKGKIQKDPLSIKKRKLSKGVEIETVLKRWPRLEGSARDGYRIELYIVENGQKEIKKARYIAFDLINNNCFIRNILQPEL